MSVQLRWVLDLAIGHHAEIDEMTAPHGITDGKQAILTDHK